MEVMGEERRQRERLRISKTEDKDMIKEKMTGW